MFLAVHSVALKWNKSKRARQMKNYFVLYQTFPMKEDINTSSALALICRKPLATDLSTWVGPIKKQIFSSNAKQLSLLLFGGDILGI